MQTKALLLNPLILLKGLQAINKILEENSKFNSVKKAASQLWDGIKILIEALSKEEVKNFDNINRFQDITKQAWEELDYLDKHIERMDKSNAIKRSFIKGNVRKKFHEIWERFKNIARTVSVFKVNEKVYLEVVEGEIRDIQLRMDKLSENIKDKNDKIMLNNVIRQPPKPQKKRSIVESESQEVIIKQYDRVGLSLNKEIDGTRAETLLQDAHWYFIGEGTK